MSNLVSLAYETRRGRYGVRLLERSSLNTCTVESTDGKLVKLVQDMAADRMWGDVPRDAAAQSRLGRMDGQARV
jgi:hypothetical protein